MSGKQIILLFHVVFFSSTLLAQHYDTVSVLNTPIQIADVVIKAGWDIGAFINRVKKDTTFYKAFRSLHIASYQQCNNITVYDKENRVKANYTSATCQYRHHGCRYMVTKQRKSWGDFYDKKGNYNYYTAKLYNYLFFTNDTVCGENDIVAGMLEENGNGKMEKSKYELKQLIFNPGSKIAGVPLMGEKANIFDATEIKKYDLKVYVDSLDGIPCLVLSIKPKPIYAKDVVYNELVTWFRQSDKSIIARNYSLSFKTMVYDFDVTMKVRLKEFGAKLLPERIIYDGNWHVFTQKREYVKFDTYFSNVVFD